MECSSESDFNSLRDCIQDIDGQTNIDETRKMVSMDVLLDSGVLTDVKVSCGDRSWDLHKLILCSRCSFFKKALTGEFQEAKTGHVILRENDPDDIDGIITYIYTGRVSNKLLKEETTDGYIHVFELGDYFDLPGLRQKALKTLEDKVMAPLVDAVIRAYANLTYKEGPLNRDAFKDSPETFEDLRRVVLAAYGGGGCPNAGVLATYEPLRELVRTFMHNTFMICAEKPKFRKLLQEVPALGADLFYCMTDERHKLFRHLLCVPPDICMRCRKHLFSYDRAEVVVSGRSRASHAIIDIQAKCPKCK